MVIIIKGPGGSGKSTLAQKIQKHMLKPNYPELIEGDVPSEKPNGLYVESKIFCTNQEVLPDWAYNSHCVIILSL